MSTIKCTPETFGKVLENELKKQIKQTKFAAAVALNNTAFKARANLDQGKPDCRGFFPERLDVYQHEGRQEGSAA